MCAPFRSSFKHRSSSSVGTSLSRLIEDFVGWLGVVKIFELGVSRLLHPAAAFWPSFLFAGFVSSGPPGNDPFRDSVPKIGLFFNEETGFSIHPLKSTPTFLKHLNNSFEADAPMIGPVSLSRFDHHQPDEIVGDHVDEDFPAQHFRRFRPLHLHSHRCFDVAKAQFDFPEVQAE